MTPEEREAHVIDCVDGWLRDAGLKTYSELVESVRDLSNRLAAAQDGEGKGADEGESKADPALITVGDIVMVREGGGDEWSSDYAIGKVVSMHDPTVPVVEFFAGDYRRDSRGGRRQQWFKHRTQLIRLNSWPHHGYRTAPGDHILVVNDHDEADRYRQGATAIVQVRYEGPDIMVDFRGCDESLFEASNNDNGYNDDDQCRLVLAGDYVVIPYLAFNAIRALADARRRVQLKAGDLVRVNRRGEDESLYGRRFARPGATGQVVEVLADNGLGTRAVVNFKGCDPALYKHIEAYGDNHKWTVDIRMLEKIDT